MEVAERKSSDDDAVIDCSALTEFSNSLFIRSIAQYSNSTEVKDGQSTQSTSSTASSSKPDTDEDLCVNTTKIDWTMPVIRRNSHSTVVEEKKQDWDALIEQSKSCSNLEQFDDSSRRLRASSSTSFDVDDDEQDDDSSNHDDEEASLSENGHPPPMPNQESIKLRSKSWDAIVPKTRRSPRAEASKKLSVLSQAVQSLTLRLEESERRVEVLEMEVESKHVLAETVQKQDTELSKLRAHRDCLLKQMEQMKETLQKRDQELTQYRLESFERESFLSPSCDRAESSSTLRIPAEEWHALQAQRDTSILQAGEMAIKLAESRAEADELQEQVSQCNLVIKELRQQINALQDKCQKLEAASPQAPRRSYLTWGGIISNPGTPSTIDTEELSPLPEGEEEDDEEETLEFGQSDQDKSMESADLETNRTRETNDSSASATPVIRSFISWGSKTSNAPMAPTATLREATPKQASNDVIFHDEKVTPEAANSASTASSAAPLRSLLSWAGSTTPPVETPPKEIPANSDVGLSVVSSTPSSARRSLFPGVGFSGFATRSRANSGSTETNSSLRSRAGSCSDDGHVLFNDEEDVGTFLQETPHDPLPEMNEATRETLEHMSHKIETLEDEKCRLQHEKLALEQAFAQFRALAAEAQAAKSSSPSAASHRKGRNANDASEAEMNILFA